MQARRIARTIEGHAALKALSDELPIVFDDRLPIAPAVVEPIIAASNLLEFKSAVGRAIDGALGIETFTLALLEKNVKEHEEIPIVSNAPKRWVQRYEQADYSKIDPRVSHALESIFPMTYDQNTFRRGREAELFEEAGAYGLRAGIVVPLHVYSGSVGMMFLATRESMAGAELATTRSVAFAMMIANFAYAGFFRQIHATSNNEESVCSGLPKLTSREKDVFLLLAKGYKQPEIADRLSISDATVYFHTTRVRQKLGTKTNMQAMALAIDGNLIQI